METERNTSEAAKKLWHIVRAVFFMLREGISRSRIMLDLNLIFKSGNKLAGKAIGSLMFLSHGRSSFSTCRSNDALSFISPREYEFSCSNTPANFYPFYNHKRKHHNHHRFAKAYKYNDVTPVAAVQKMLEMLNNHEVVVPEAATAASPVIPLPEFGKSPMVRQLRISDSPFPLKDEENSQVVDKAAEEFIKKFYKDLMLQKGTPDDALESPNNVVWSR